MFPLLDLNKQIPAGHISSTRFLHMTGAINHYFVINLKVLQLLVYDSLFGQTSVMKIVCENSYQRKYETLITEVHNPAWVFSVNLLNIFRTPFSKNTFGGLLLEV